MDFSETIAACDLKVGRNTRPRCQVSVYRTIGPLVLSTVMMKI